MGSAPPFTFTNESITVVWEGKPHVVQKGAPQFAALRKAIISEDWDAVPKCLTVAKSLQEWAKGKFTVQGNVFSYEGRPMPANLNERVLAMATKNLDPTPVLNFWERLSKNPSYRSVEQLWEFLQHKGIPLTEDGCFLAYKGVRTDFKDQHSGTFDNSPGAKNEMPRNQISDDPRVECHEGFHVGALEYAKSFASRVVVCKVDPENVVSVPYDHSAQKMRVCKYEVIGNHNGSHLPSTVFIPDENDPTEADVTNREYESEDDDPDYDPESDPLLESEEQMKEIVNKPKKETKEPKRASKKGYAKLDKMDMEKLMEQSIEDLRKYAGKGLEITGASKIPGGKVALVSKILEVRK